MPDIPHKSITKQASRERGSVLYDGDCRLCLELANRFGPILRRAGFDLLPLQSDEGERLVAKKDGDPLREMAVVTADGAIFGGADACLLLARYIWWARPLRLIARLPGGKRLCHALYRWVAANRHCYRGACAQPAAPGHTRHKQLGRTAQGAAARPVTEHPFAHATLLGAGAGLPVITLLATRHLEPWIMMWSVAISIFFACKFLTIMRQTGEQRRFREMLPYLVLWPGMDPRPFAHRETEAGGLEPIPDARAWIAPVLKLAAGALLLWLAVPAIGAAHPLAAGWAGMLGIVLLLHFGFFHLLALEWQRRGVGVRPLMESPLGAPSLAEFWGGRWNRGFSDLARDFIYRPYWRRIGPAGCTLLVFLISGLVHELVISVPARGGYGLPTLYFLVQGVGLLVERSRAGRKAGLGRGLRGRIFGATILAAPLFWLFHPAFIDRVMIPFLKTISSL